MPSDDTRHVLKAFGVAVTAYEDSVEAGALPDEMKTAAAELAFRLQEVMALVDRLRAASPTRAASPLAPKSLVEVIGL